MCREAGGPSSLLSRLGGTVRDAQRISSHLAISQPGHGWCTGAVPERDAGPLGSGKVVQITDPPEPILLSFFLMAYLLHTEAGVAEGVVFMSSARRGARVPVQL